MKGPIDLYIRVFVWLVKKSNNASTKLTLFAVYKKLILKNEKDLPAIYLKYF